MILVGAYLCFRRRSNTEEPNVELTNLGGRGHETPTTTVERDLGLVAPVDKIPIPTIVKDDTRV